MNRFRLSSALFFGAALALSNSSHAQETGEKTFPEVAVEPIESSQIRVRNVASNLMAYWLDPQHQPTPIQIQTSQKNAGLLFRTGFELPHQPGNGNGPSDLKLPSGIQGLVSVDPQNVLRFKGTKAGIEELQKKIEEIDVPLNEIEFEMQIWEMSPDKLKSLPLIFRGTAKPANTKENSASNTDFLSRIALAAPTSDIASTSQILSAGLKDKSANLIITSRLNVIDGLVGTLQSNESRSLVFDGWTSDAPRNKPKTEAKNPPTPDESKNAFPEGLAFISGQTGITVGPILHGNAMSLVFSINFDGSSTQAATTLRDGQTLAVRLPNDDPATGWPRIALIKAHIIRRADGN